MFASSAYSTCIASMQICLLISCEEILGVTDYNEVFYCCWGWLGGVQILFLTDPIDEYLTQNLTEYEGNKFQNASKDDLKIGSQARTKEIKESYKELTKWWKDILAGENVESVKVQICSFTTWVDFARVLILKR